MHLAPVPTVPASALPAAQRTLVLDAAFASVTGAFYGGVILAAFALALGANARQIGLLAAVPTIAQLAQLPATVLIERLRQRRRLGVLTITAGRVLIASLAVLPFVPDQHDALRLLILMQIPISVLHSIGGCAVNSWLHQLVPHDILGRFFARRLLWGTAAASVATLVAGWLVEHLPVADRTHAYAVAFVLAGLAGFASSWFLARAPEPAMPAPARWVGLGETLWEPFEDRNFRRLLIFLGAWGVASTLAGPFITVFLLKQLELPLTLVTAMGVASQLAAALTLVAWGRVSDRFSNKGVLAAALPLHFACMFVLVFGDAVRDETLRIALLFAIHIVLGIVGGGIGLATGNLGLKLAPKDRGTAYLAAIGIVSALAGGITPIVAGSIAHGFEQSELLAVLRWAHSAQAGEIVVVRFAHWEFLFALSALAGLYVMHALSRVREGDEVSERVVMQEFAFEALRGPGGLSAIGGSLGAIFPFFDRLAVRFGRRPRSRRADASY
jgi:MFS family permease